MKPKQAGPKQPEAAKEIKPKQPTKGETTLTSRLAPQYLPANTSYTPFVCTLPTTTSPQLWKALLMEARDLTPSRTQDAKRTAEEKKLINAILIAREQIHKQQVRTEYVARQIQATQIKTQ